MTSVSPGVVSSLHGTVVGMRPLVHCVTNVVAANVSANALLALGASPAMVEDADEAAELAAGAGALVVNTGTMSLARAAGMRAAADAAHQAGVPWLLDPVGVGAVSLRTQVARDLLTHGPAVVRGNASEIPALVGHDGGGHGMDAADEVAGALEDADRLATGIGGAVAVSGPVDVVTDGAGRVEVGGGHPVMAQVTAMGCALGAIMGAFLAAGAATGTAPSASAVAASAFVGATGADAALATSGPGTFVPAWLDRLAAPDLDHAERLVGAP